MQGNRLTPTPAPTYQEHKNIFMDTVGEGVMTLGKEILGGAGDVLKGGYNVGAGLLGGMGNILQGKAPTTEQTEKFLYGGTKAIGGAVRATYAGIPSVIAALPSGAENAVNTGLGYVGHGVNYAMDLVPRGIGAGVIQVGAMTGNQGMVRTGAKIGQSAESPEWAKVKETAMLLPGMGAMTRTLPFMPKNLQRLATKPGEVVLKGIGKTTVGIGKGIFRGGEELFSKMVLEKPLAQALKKQAVKNKNIMPALSGKLSLETVVPKAINVIDDIKSKADIVRNNTLSYLKRLEEFKIKSGKSPTVTPIISKVDSLLDQFGVVRTAKGLVPKGGDVASTPLTGSQLKQFSEVIKGMSKKQMTPTEFWNVRSKIGDIVQKMERTGELSPKLKAFTDQLYSSWNAAGRNQIKGLAKRDTKLSSAIEKLKPVQKLFYDKDGNVLPNEQIAQALQSATGKGRARFEELRHLEKIVPGIGKELKAISLANQIQQKAGPAVGQYGRGAMQGFGTFGALSGNFPLAIASGVASVASSPQNVSRAIVKGTQAQKALAKKVAPIAKKVAPIAKKTSEYIQKKQPWDIAMDIGALAKKALKK